jgi:hypothetical protein
LRSVDFAAWSADGGKAFPPPCALDLAVLASNLSKFILNYSLLLDFANKASIFVKFPNSVTFVITYPDRLHLSQLINYFKGFNIVILT